MADTFFEHRKTPIAADWLNDVNDTVYGLGDTGGAGLVGFDWATLPSALNKVDWGIRTSQTGVNVLRYIPPAEWAAIQAGTSTTNLAPYIQTAWNSNKHVYHPGGTYPLGAALRIPTQMHLTGAGISTIFKALPALSGVTVPSITASTYSPVLAKVPMFYNESAIQWWSMSDFRLDGDGQDVYGLWLAENFYGSIRNVYVLDTLGRPYTNIRGQAITHDNFVCYGCGDGVITYDNTNLIFQGGGFERLSGEWSFDQRQPNSFAKGGVSLQGVWFESDLTNFPTQGFLRMSGRRNIADVHFALATTASTERGLELNDTTSSRVIDGITMGAQACTGGDFTINNASGAMFTLARTGTYGNTVRGNYTVARVTDSGTGNTFDVNASLATPVPHVLKRFQVRNGDTGAGLPIGATNWVIDVDQNGGAPIIRMLGSNNNTIDSNSGNLRFTSNLGQQFVCTSGQMTFNANNYLFTGASGATGFQKPLYLGSFSVWVDSSGRLRIKSGAPVSDTDGTVVGTQT